MTIVTVTIPRATSFATPALVYSTSNSSGTGGALRADDTVAIFSTTTPTVSVWGVSSSTGDNAFGSREDHVHGFVAQDKSCRIYDASTQSLPNDTETAINFDLENYDSDTMHDNTTNNTRITFTSAGKYSGAFNINFNAASGGERRLKVVLNGSTNVAQVKLSNPDGADHDTMQIVWNYEADADDYIECMAYQNSGDAINSRVDGIAYPAGWAARSVDT